MDGSSSSTPGVGDKPSLAMGLLGLIIHHSDTSSVSEELQSLLMVNEITDCEILSCLTMKDCTGLSASMSAEAALVFGKVRSGSSKNKNGLIATLAIREKVKAVAAQYHSPIVPPVNSQVPIKASKSIVAVTNRITFGTNKDTDAPPLAVPILDLIDANMDLAALTCHEMIMHYVPTAGRLKEISVGGK